MPEDEKEEVLAEVGKLAWVLDTVNALLPVFYAMQHQIEPAKRLKIMAYMFRDQLELLPSRQCILRKADLEKLKMQMSRCIHYVRTSNPTISQFIVDEYKKEAEANRQRQAQQQQSQAQTQGLANNHAGATGLHGIVPSAGQPQMGGVDGGEDDDAAAMHGIKRGLRVEDLRPPPIKRGKGQGQPEAQKIDSSPAATTTSPQTGIGSPSLGAKGAAAKKGQGQRGKGKKSLKVDSGKDDGVSTPTPAPATAATGKTPKQKPKTSQDIFNEVKAEMAEAERKKTQDDGLPLPSQAQAPVENPAMVAEREANERRQRASDLSRNDPAGFAENAWQELFNASVVDGQQPSMAPGTTSGALGNGGVLDNKSLLGLSMPMVGVAGSASSDGTSLESILTMLGHGVPGGSNDDVDGTQGQQPPQQSPAEQASMSQQHGLPTSDKQQSELQSSSDQTDAVVDVDLFDFLDAEAIGPDAYPPQDPEAELANLLSIPTNSSLDEPPVETPELVTSSNLPSTSTSSSSGSSAKSLKMMASTAALKGSRSQQQGFDKAGPNSTSPASMQQKAGSGLAGSSSGSSEDDDEADEQATPADALAQLAVGLPGTTNHKKRKSEAGMADDEEWWWEANHVEQPNPWAVIQQ